MYWLYWFTRDETAPKRALRVVSHFITEFQIIENNIMMKKRIFNEPVVACDV